MGHRFVGIFTRQVLDDAGKADRADSNVDLKFSRPVSGRCPIQAIASMVGTNPSADQVAVLRRDHIQAEGRVAERTLDRCITLHDPGSQPAHSLQPIAATALDALSGVTELSRKSKNTE